MQVFGKYAELMFFVRKASRYHVVLLTLNSLNFTSRLWTMLKHFDTYCDQYKIVASVGDMQCQFSLTHGMHRTDVPLMDL